ncbi:helix-turn-helix transcriptional regulator [Streptomyces sp. NBC_00448]|uniref:helix-turn-helix transcriptional regulator n=1 Tax=Streptomyces sp. NBC_00448 TaxID=2903652 RepID=UPI002E2451F0
MPSDLEEPMPDVSAALPALARLREDLRQAESAVAGMLDSWHRVQGASIPGLVEFVEGREAQGRRLTELEYGARVSILVCQSGANRVAPVPSTFTTPVPDAAEPAEDPRGTLAGVDYRVLVDRDFLSEPTAVRALDERLAEGHRVRVMDHPLTKLVVADGELAMVQISPEQSMVLRPPLVTLVCELFEAHWRRSRPYLREEGDLAPNDRRILQLMLSGLTDSATANQLGTSPRTVQRRVRALMDAAAVTSRVQLGWYAIRNNWV